MANNEMLEAYTAWADRTGLEILEWSAEAKFYNAEGKAIFPRPTKDWPLTDFRAAFAIAAGYLVFVFLGRLIMTFLPPVTNLTYPIRFVYNIVQVMLCSYMTIEAGLLAYRNGYTVMPCNPFNTKSPPVATLLWLFYVSKVLDFFDTLFIILGKKWNQLSLLHVYHHLTIFSVYWINVNIGYDGDIYLTIVLNGFIHTVMYTYYFVSMHTDKIWWKKYLTMMQLAQFITMNAQAIYLLYVDCKTFPKRVTQIYLFYIISLFVLFLKFFFESYGKKPRSNATESSSSSKTKLQ